MAMSICCDDCLELEAEGVAELGAWADGSHELAVEGYLAKGTDDDGLGMGALPQFAWLVSLPLARLGAVTND